MRIDLISAEDADAVQVFAADPRITSMTTLPEPYPENGAAWWIADLLPRQRAGTEYAFVMEATQGQFVGVCGLADVKGPGGAAELGYWVGVPFWGRGYASAACAWVLEFAFQTLQLEEVHAYPLEENGASRRVLEKHGFSLEALVPNKYPKWSAERRLAFYRLTRSQWESHAAELLLGVQ